MKYVIVNHNGCEVPIMFADVIEHVMFKYNDPISAGKFRAEIEPEYLDEIVITTYGESTSLKLKPRPEDADIIKHAFEFQE